MIFLVGLIALCVYAYIIHRKSKADAKWYADARERMGKTYKRWQDERRKLLMENLELRSENWDMQSENEELRRRNDLLRKMNAQMDRRADGEL